MIRKKKLLAALLGVVLLFFAADYLVGRREATVIREREARKERLEKLAFYMIVPDIQDVADIKNAHGEYEAVFKIENLADEPVYITYPRVIAYVQTGTFWTEVPVREVDKGPQEQVLRLERGVHLYRKIVTISRDIKYTYYQMFGYMHVRFRISMFVLPESAFKEEEVLERYADAYIYLKPYYMSDREIARQVKFPDDKIPVMIPMPPH
ncbi:MAG: hypothetical protein M1497_15260 [Nitrospirae bacterium]|nr:hypothetical protein [Nitrospirota bacterium]